MSDSLLSVGIFLAVIVCLPFVAKWVKNRTHGEGRMVAGQSKVVSAVAVGPHQRVVTVEVGPPGERVWLTVGVTAQSITCLHTGGVVGAKTHDPSGVATHIAPL